MHNTASNPYSLKAMTIVVVIFLPLVLAYQTWTYYVFRRRVSRDQFVPKPPPAASGPAGDITPGTPAPTVAPPGKS